MSRRCATIVLALLFGLGPATEAEGQTRAPGDEEFFETVILPRTLAFSTLPGLPFKGTLSTNDIVKWKFLRSVDSEERVVATIYITNRLSITLFIRGTNAVVTFFRDSRVNPHAIAGRDSSRAARFFHQEVDLLNDHTALDLASCFFSAAGHKTENFRLSRVWHLGWGDPADREKYIPLPFYEFEWLRKDVAEVKPGEVHHPQVKIVVSGLTRTVLIYERLNLPVCGDFADRSN